MVTLSIHYSPLAAGTAAPAPHAAMLKVATADEPGVAAAAPQAPPAALDSNLFVGFDAARDCGKFAGRIRDAKISFVARYYSHSASKNLTASEAQLLNHAGILLVSVWERQGDHVSFFTRLQGVDDATSAYNLAMQVGQPAGTPIYFAVDCDPMQNELNGTIIPYFQGVAAGSAR